MNLKDHVSKHEKKYLMITKFISTIGLFIACSFVVRELNGVFESGNEYEAYLGAIAFIYALLFLHMMSIFNFYGKVETLAEYIGNKFKRQDKLNV